MPFINYHKVGCAILVLIFIAGFPTGFAAVQSFPYGFPQKLTEVQVIHVPADESNLQSAIDQINDGGIIELEAGSYVPPPGGFRAFNLQKGFTIRAADGSIVILDGQGTRDIMRVQNSSLSMGGPITFDGLVFANGYTSTDGTAAGVTLYYAEATFVDCEFRGNHANTRTMGGGAYIAEHSRVFFVKTNWFDNTSRIGGGALGVRSGSAVYIHQNVFSQNRTNNANHDLFSSGGAINLANSDLTISDTYFDRNEAGAYGGAIQILGSWQEPLSTPRSNVMLANVTFTGNKAERHNTFSATFPTEGGALNVEGQTLLRLYHNHFEKNQADIGGGINVYRAKMEVYNSSFLGNQAVGEVSTASFGGTISINSADLASDGAYNKPAANVTIEDSYLQGAHEDIVTVAHTGGCVYVMGDVGRVDGDPTLPDVGTIAENRASLLLRSVVLNDCDVRAIGSHSGMGGGILAALADLVIDNSMIIHSDAFGSSASGGGIALIENTKASINASTLGYDTSGLYGGGIFMVGSEVYVAHSNFIHNEISPGFHESSSSSYGAAVFSSPDDYGNTSVGGVFNHNTFSGNIGIPIFEDDNQSSPINTLRYDDNVFYETTYDGLVLKSSLSPPVNVSELNSLVISRSNAPSSLKSLVGNHQLVKQPITVDYAVVPRSLTGFDNGQVSLPLSPSFLVILWQAPSAKLDDYKLSSPVYVTSLDQASTMVLQVSNANYWIDVEEIPHPTADLTISTNGGTAYLNWRVQTTDMLLGALDSGLHFITENTQGQVMMPPLTRNYHFYVIAPEGGVVVERNSIRPELNAPAELAFMVSPNDGLTEYHIPIRNIGGGVMNWSAWVYSGDVITILEPQEIISGDGVVKLTVDNQFGSGRYTSTIFIDAGAAGSKLINIDVMIVEHIFTYFLPFGFW